MRCAVKGMHTWKSAMSSGISVKVPCRLRLSGSRLGASHRIPRAGTCTCHRDAPLLSSNRKPPHSRSSRLGFRAPLPISYSPTRGQGLMPVTGARQRS